MRGTVAASALAVALAVAGCGGGDEGGKGAGGGSEDLVAAVETCFKEAQLPDVRVTEELQPEVLDAGAEAAVLSHAPEEYSADQVVVFDSAENAKAYSDAQTAEDKAQNQGALKGVVNFAAFGRSSVLTYGEGPRQDKIIACARENP
jgi:hypothetical protein